MAQRCIPARRAAGRSGDPYHGPGAAKPWIVRRAGRELRGPLATIIFDFDSTLVGCESLEEIARHQLKGDENRARQYQELTNAGMAGTMTFNESLRARLEIARPHRSALVRFGQQAPHPWTAGVPDLVGQLMSAGHEVWIVSGAPIEVLIAAGAQLGIPPERIRGVRLKWSATGEFEGVDPDDPFSHSKVLGVSGLEQSWPSPRIMVGDGATDRALYDHGLVNFFIPFTAHVRRPEVLGDGVPEANSVQRLEELIGSYL
ncbi:MAG: HAD-IB family phosphatase [Longimicrobiales bacterium]